MKIHSIIGLILLSILIGPVAGMAQTTVIDDSTDGATTYWGGTVYPPSATNRDVMSPAGYHNWDISSMVVTVTGTTVDVKIVGPWFDSVTYPINHAGDAASLYGGYGSGDLYISSTGWKVSTNDSPHFPTDTFIADPSNAKYEGWNYVVGYKYTIVPGVGVEYIPGVYSLNYNTINPSDAGCGALGRCNQAFYGGEDQFIEPAKTIYDGASGDNSSLTFEFDNFLSGNVGLHWTMYCGNDVVEGQANFGVPEPSALILLSLGLGLAGLGIYTRRTVQRVGS